LDNKQGNEKRNYTPPTQEQSFTGERPKVFIRAFLTEMTFDFL
jgi:hypothetical protein